MENNNMNNTETLKEDVWKTTSTFCSFKDGKEIPDTCITCNKTENGFVVYFDNIRKDWQTPLFSIKESNNPKCKEMTKEEFNNMFVITAYYQLNQKGKNRVWKIN